MISQLTNYAGFLLNKYFFKDILKTYSHDSKIKNLIQGKSKLKFTTISVKIPNNFISV